ncbi:hypothetical protein [Chenggangzhangella methanolivorans]|uniref:Uncharacterized protein n=1 Tax=Chenggangzhangella methanolivorans TaxID=1437009 RepID=A0A9E6RFB0_9HYPH|nr:hypothetical protein [Chenggangzhangella methanolivorans]QZN99901.1 hypothetical protein K6K41_25240 [Chenggangzhangella methanolivorans]
MIGNSHIGAIKSGWDRIDEASRPVALEFFGSKSQSLQRTFVEDGVLKSDDEQIQRSLLRTGGAPEIDLRRYDMFVLVGGGVHFKALGRMLRNATLYPDATPGRRLVSQPALTEAFRRRVEALAAWDLSVMISSVTDAPIYVLPEPFFDKDVMKATHKPFMKQIHELGIGEQAAAAFDAACERTFSRFGGFVAQPRETREDHIFTASKYALAPVSMRRMMDMDLDARDDDFVHKNDEYGELMMRAFLALAGLSASK